MSQVVDFIYDADLVAAVIKLIRSSKNRLVLISPFIDLDARVIDALNEKKTLHNFELKVLFGKNENNYMKSIKRDSLEFLKQFPNVEIRYNDRLHAKFYQNDYEYIMTSLNLYDYSLANNIEVGIRCEFAGKGIVDKALDMTNSMVGQGVDKIKHDVLGFDKGITPMDKFKMIFESSELKFKTEPNVVEKSGVQGWIGSKKLDGFKIVVDNLQPEVKQTNISVSNTVGQNIQVTVNQSSNKCLSASQLAKHFNIQTREVTTLMHQHGLIDDDKITEAGKARGLIMKSYMGNDYIAYPENLEELNFFVKG